MNRTDIHPERFEASLTSNLVWPKISTELKLFSHQSPSQRRADRRSEWKHSRLKAAAHHTPEQQTQEETFDPFITEGWIKYDLDLT